LEALCTITVSLLPPPRLQGPAAGGALAALASSLPPRAPMLLNFCLSMKQRDEVAR
jgi:hypothetical protein